jgi:hypothetical protein
MKRRAQNVNTITADAAPNSNRPSLVMLVTLLLPCSLLAIGFHTDFRWPKPIVSVAVLVFLMALNLWARKKPA